MIFISILNVLNIEFYEIKNNIYIYIYIERERERERDDMMTR